MSDLLLLSVIPLWVLSVIQLLLIFALVRRYNRGTEAQDPTNQMLEKGEVFPDLEFQTLENQKRVLSDYRLNELLVIFFSPTCQPCREILPEVQNVYVDAKSHGVEFVSISLADLENTKSFVEDITYDLPTLVGIDKDQVSKVAKVQGTPSFYLIDVDGKIKDRGFFGSKWKEMQKNWQPPLT